MAAAQHATRTLSGVLLKKATRIHEEKGR